MKKISFLLVLASFSAVHATDDPQIPIQEDADLSAKKQRDLPYVPAFGDPAEQMSLPYVPALSDPAVSTDTPKEKHSYNQQNTEKFLKRITKVYEDIKATETVTLKNEKARDFLLGADDNSFGAHHGALCKAFFEMYPFSEPDSSFEPSSLRRWREATNDLIYITGFFTTKDRDAFKETECFKISKNTQGLEKFIKYNLSDERILLMRERRIEIENTWFKLRKNN